MISERYYVMAWINIDKPLKTCTYHSEDSCRHVMDKGETPHKGLDALKRDGGWIEFSSYLEARKFYSDHFPSFKFINHC